MITSKRFLMLNTGLADPIDTEGKRIVGIIVTASDLPAFNGPSSESDGASITIGQNFYAPTGYSGGGVFAFDRNGDYAINSWDANGPGFIGKVFPVDFYPTSPVNIAIQGPGVPTPFSTSYFVTGEIILAD